MFILAIIEGWSKYLFDIIFNHISEKAKKKLEICNNCEHNKNGICDKCGCIIKAKVRVDYIEDENGISIEGCPERKW